MESPTKHQLYCAECDDLFSLEDERICDGCLCPKCSIELDTTWPEEEYIIEDTPF